MTLRLASKLGRYAQKCCTTTTSTFSSKYCSFSIQKLHFWPFSPFFHILLIFKTKNLVTLLDWHDITLILQQIWTLCYILVSLHNSFNFLKATLSLKILLFFVELPFIFNSYLFNLNFDLVYLTNKIFVNDHIWFQTWPSMKWIFCLLILQTNLFMFCNF
jgi:hypothetical protein